MLCVQFVASQRLGDSLTVDNFQVNIASQTFLFPVQMRLMSLCWLYGRSEFPFPLIGYCWRHVHIDSLMCFLHLYLVLARLCIFIPAHVKEEEEEKIH